MLKLQELKSNELNRNRHFINSEGCTIVFSIKPDDYAVFRYTTNPSWAVFSKGRVNGRLKKIAMQKISLQSGYKTSDLKADTNFTD
jgi:hypothetical protein